MSNFVRQQLVITIDQLVNEKKLLKEENKCLKTDLKKFKLWSNNYQRLVDKIFSDVLVLNNNILNEIK